MNEASEILALTLIFVVHVVGGLMLVWGMIDGGSQGGGPRWRPRRGGGPDDQPPDARPTSPPPARTPLPLPLPGCVPSHVRTRDGKNLRDAHPRPPRRPGRTPRPQHEPQRR